MSLRLVAALAVLGVSVAACTTTPPRENASRLAWSKAGATPDDYTNSMSECKFQMGIHKTSTWERDDLLRSCMQSKGYRGAVN